MRETINPRDIRLAALDLLARREHLRRELEIKLARRFSNAEAGVIAKILQQLTAENLQSDQRFCESYIRARSGRGYGPERIRGELRRKGAEADIIELEMASCGTDWMMLARHTRVRKFGEAIPTEFKEKSKQQRFLQYRGFSGELASSTFKPVDE